MATSPVVIPFGGARVVGGPAISPGAAYLVGEQDSEIVVPRRQASRPQVRPGEDNDRGYRPVRRPSGDDVHLHTGAIVVKGAPDPRMTA